MQMMMTRRTRRRLWHRSPYYGGYYGIARTYGYGSGYGYGGYGYGGMYGGYGGYDTPLTRTAGEDRAWNRGRPYGMRWGPRMSYSYGGYGGYGYGGYGYGGYGYGRGYYGGYGRGYCAC